MASLRSMVLLLASCLLWTSSLSLETLENSALSLENPETEAHLAPVEEVEEVAGDSLDRVERVVREANKRLEPIDTKTEKKAARIAARKVDKKAADINKKSKNYHKEDKKSEKNGKKGKKSGKIGKKNEKSVMIKKKNKSKSTIKKDTQGGRKGTKRMKINVGKKANVEQITKQGNEKKSKQSKESKRQRGNDKRRRGRKLKDKNHSNTNHATKKRRLQQRASTINLTCLTNTVKLLKFMKDNVLNFLDRHTRQERQNNLTTAKGNKKGEFAEPSARLVQAGGGNKSALACGGSLTSVGAVQLLNLTTRLDNCSSALQAVCVPPAGINQTFLTECVKKSTGFNRTLIGCLTTALKGEDACSCFENKTLVGAMTDLKNCSGIAEAKLAAATRTLCLAQIRSCNADIESAGKLQYTCQFTVTEMKQTLAQIANNNATVQKMIGTVTNLTGVSAPKPVMNTTTDKTTTTTKTALFRAVREAVVDSYPEMTDLVDREPEKAARAKRQATTCASITTIVKACTAAVSDAPASKKVVMTCTIPSTATAATCTRGVDLTALQAAVNSLDTAQRIFTAFTISLQEELGASSGTTVSPTALAVLVAGLGGGGMGTTAASGRSRNILRRMVMDKMKK